MTGISNGGNSRVSHDNRISRKLMMDAGQRGDFRLRAEIRIDCD